jgi:predicted transcriptional regulator of viral defense system
MGVPARAARRRAPGLPPVLARADNQIVRPRDLADTYRNPHAELGRMTERGLVRRIAHGYYAVVPEAERGGYWHPPIEAVALGIAAADFGRDEAALMGITAARALGAVPRALNTAVVAVPRQRPALETESGRVHFVKRAIATLQLQRTETPLVAGYATTPEQTVLDLAARPTLGGITEITAHEAIRALWPRCDRDVVEELAHQQLKGQTWRRLQRLLEDAATTP